MGNKPGAGNWAQEGEAAKGKPFDSSQVHPNAAIGERLKGVPLLARFTDEELAMLGGTVVEKSFKDKEFVVHQGEVGTGFFILTEGEAVVTRHDPSVPEGKREETVVGSLKAGDYFGEAALVNQSKRGASVQAHGPIKTFYLERAAFAHLFQEERFNVQFAKRAAISAEAATAAGKAQPVAAVLAPPDAMRDKPAATRNVILQAVRGNLLFEGLSFEHKNLIIDQMYRMEVRNGTTVIKQGDRGDNLYVVESGAFDVFVSVSGRTRRVSQRGPGTVFGELALMYNSPRAATVTVSAARRARRLRARRPRPTASSGWWTDSPSGASSPTCPTSRSRSTTSS